MPQEIAPFRSICLTAKKIIALWPNAVQQGRVAGNQMACESDVVGGTYSVNAIDFFGLRICTCGLINAQGEQYSDKSNLTVTIIKGLFSRAYRLVGFVLINSSKMPVFIQVLFQTKLTLIHLRVILWIHHQYLCLIKKQEFKN